MNKQEMSDHSHDQREGGAVNGRTNSSDRGVLLITCSDIGIDPYTLFGRDYFHVYVIQNAGNLVRSGDPDVAASLALYDVQLVVLCGHSRCDVIRHLPRSALGAIPPTSPAAPIVYPTGHQFPGDGTDGGLITSHLLAQFQNLLTLPEVVRRKTTKALDLYCWVYDNDTGSILEYDSHAHAFRPKR